MVVGDERLGEEEVQHVAVDGALRPGLVLEEADGRLVAVEGRPELGFLDQGPGPSRLVAPAPGRLADAGGLFGRLLEFLLVDELVEAFAVELWLGL